MGAYLQLKSFYPQGLEAKARDLNYSEANLLILSGDAVELKKQFPKIYTNLLSCSHNKDRRSFMEYAQDLVASWIFEDDLMLQLRANGLQIKSAGADKDCVILSDRRVSASSDYVVSWAGKRVFLELMSDYTGYWTRNGQMDLRDGKYKKLIRSKSLFLGISLKDKKFIFIDFAKDINATYIAKHRPYGFKPAYKIIIDRNSLISFNIKELITLIKNAVEKR